MEFKLGMTESFKREFGKMLSDLLEEITSGTENWRINPPDYLTVNQTQEYLGISYYTLQKLELEFGLESVTVLGNKKRFIKTTLDAFMHSLEQ